METALSVAFRKQSGWSKEGGRKGVSSSVNHGTALPDQEGASFPAGIIASCLICIKTFSPFKSSLLSLHLISLFHPIHNLISSIQSQNIHTYNYISHSLIFTSIIYLPFNVNMKAIVLSAVVLATSVAAVNITSCAVRPLTIQSNNTCTDSHSKCATTMLSV